MQINCLSKKPDGDYLKLLNSGLSNNNLELKNSRIDGAGIGVFAKTNFKKDDIVERCPIVIINPSNNLDLSVVEYSFSYNCDCEICKRHGGTLAILPLGYGGMYNTALTKPEANIDYYININSKVLIFYATKNIKVGDEILTFYGMYYINHFINKQNMLGISNNMPL